MAFPLFLNRTNIFLALPRTSHFHVFWSETIWPTDISSTPTCLPINCRVSRSHRIDQTLCLSTKWLGWCFVDQNFVDQMCVDQVFFDQTPWNRTSIQIDPSVITVPYFIEGLPWDFHKRLLQGVCHYIRDTKELLLKGKAQYGWPPR